MDLFEPVGHVDDTDPVGDGAADKFEEAVDLGRRKRRCGLVENEDPHRILGLEGAGHGDLGPLDRGQLRDQDIRVEVEADDREDLAGAAAFAAPADPPARSGLVGVTEPQVLEDAQVVEEPELLMDETESGLMAGMRVAVGEGLAVDDERSAALIGFVETGEDLDQGRLSGAVVPDQRVDFGRVHGEGDVVEGLGTDEGLRDIGNRQKGVHPQSSLLRKKHPGCPVVPLFWIMPEGPGGPS